MCRPEHPCGGTRSDAATEKKRISGIVGSLDFLFAIAHAAEPHLHIGLTAAQPDISDQHIVEFDRLMPFDLRV